MTGQECDLWLLTEVSDRVELPGMRRHMGRELMAARRHWAAIVSHHRFEPLDDPHPASASVRVGASTFVSTVLPWRSCRDRHPWIGTRHEEKTRAAVGSVIESLQGPVVWGGDWNHALHGPEYAGSRAGRAHLEEAIDRLDLQVPTEFLPHRINGLLSIDHIALPIGAVVGSAERIAAAFEGKRLSDHDAYVVTVQGVPIYDKVLRQVMGLEKSHWAPLNTALRADEQALHHRLLALRDEAGVQETVSPLRVLDVIARRDGKNLDYCSSPRSTRR
ncbi:hypothetical protein GCM10025782_26220 [Pedococcus ginsenosidimutans]|uniref:Endonuclease/exonuclease/phosphatase domain-containing protein n=2 Tax=Pedococcus ginsenosidimutans TaxID=490570 RepID=A0ABP8YHK5_9MICO